MHLGVTAVPLSEPEVLEVFPPKLHFCPLHATPGLEAHVKWGQGQLAYIFAKCTLSMQWKASTYPRHHRDSQLNRR